MEWFPPALYLTQWGGSVCWSVFHWVWWESKQKKEDGVNGLCKYNYQCPHGLLLRGGGLCHGALSSLEQFSSILGPWVDSPMILIWNEMGCSPPGSFPLASLSQEGLTWALQRWRCPWQVYGSIPCWLFHFPLWAIWKRFPRSAKEEPHCRADSKQPSG